MSSEAITQNDLKAILDEVLPVQDPDEWIEIPLTITVTTGDLGNGYIKAYRSKDLLQFVLYNLNRAANTSVGANMFAANITGLPQAFIPTMGLSYYNTSGVPIYINSTGANTATITARVIGATLTANSPLGLTSVMTRFI